jgi:hypothetical protein
MADEKFTYSGTTLTFATAGHLMSDVETLVPTQVSDVTMGGIRLTANLGSARHQWQVTVIVPNSSTSQTDLTDILSFVGSTGINYGAHSFTWTDYNGTTRSVNLINDSVSIDSLSASLRRVSFQLEQVNS